MLGGKTGALRDFIVMNAAAGLKAARITDDFRTAAEMAAEAIDSGKVRALVEKYVALSNEKAPKGPTVTAAAPQFLRAGMYMPGATEPHTQFYKYQTAGGIVVHRTKRAVDPFAAVDELIGQLDSRLGLVISSGYEYPGRYTQWERGFVDPPLVVTGRSSGVTVAALNSRGEVMLETHYIVHRYIECGAPSLYSFVRHCALSTQVGRDHA